jgi:hypothetical protein
MPTFSTGWLECSQTVGVPEFLEVGIFCVLGAWEVADMPSVDPSRRLRATLHEHSYLLPERVLADRSLNLSNGFHRLIVNLQEAISPSDASDG